jgi:PPM family protein phosphatase
MLSDIGNIRTTNEDSLGSYIDNEKKIYVIADGMGGYNAGEVASKLAVDSIIGYVKLNFNSNDNIYSLLKDAVLFANKKILEIAKDDLELTGMGTTVTACLIKDNSLIVANVGDSRCYVIKNSDIYKITKDHSYVQELIDSGSISEEEAVRHPQKNIITRALGVTSDIEVDLFEVDLSEIKKIILCTDGLTNEVNKSEILELVINNDEEKACSKLIELSKLKGGKDNISVIVFRGECKE